MNRKPLAIASSFLLLWTIWAPSPAAAGIGMEEEGFLADIPTVITASLKRQKLDTVPGTMTVITEKQIRDLGIKSLDDALRTVPGFAPYQQSYGPQGFWVRGYRFSASHLKVMLDGYPLTSAYNGDLEAWWDMPLDNVKQIEVIRGPGSSLYGTNSISAVINIISKKEAGGSVSLSGGSFGRAGGGASFNTDPDKPLRVRANFNQFGEKGDKLSYKTDFLNPASAFFPSAAPITKKKRNVRYEAGGALEYKNFALEVRKAENTKDWTEGYVGIHSNDRQWVTARAAYLEARYRQPFSEESALTLKTSVDQQSQNYQGKLFNPIPFYPQGAFYDSEVVARAYTGQALYETVLGRQSLALGAEYGIIHVPEVTSGRNFVNAIFAPAKPWVEVSGQNPDNFSLAEGHHQGRWALFAQDILDLQPITLIAGARVDQYQVAGHAFSPRAAAIWEAPWNQTFKASFGQAFFAPTMSSRYVKALGFVGNPDLGPQVSKTYEVSVQNSYSLRLHYAITGFITRMSNVARFNPALTPAYDNKARNRFYGWEVEGKWDLLANLNLWGNYTLARGKDTSGNGSRFGPRYLVSGGVTYFPLPELSVSAHGQYVAEQPRYGQANAGEVPPFARMNASVNYQATQTLSFSVSATNLLDREILYYNDQGRITGLTPGFGNDYPSPGRQVIAGAEYRFGGKS